MLKLDRDHYLRLRREFEPKNIRLVIVAESLRPPENTSTIPQAPLKNRSSQPSCCNSALSTTKEIGLRNFNKELGVGGRNIPAGDKLTKDASHDRDEVIARDYPLLLDDLASLTPNRSVRCSNQSERLPDIGTLAIEDGFSVLNGGRAIYFPSHGRQTDFKNQFSAVLSGSPQ